MEPHVYIMNLKKMMIKKDKKYKKMFNQINKIYVVFDTKTLMPESIELHYASDELEDEYSYKGSQVQHKVYQFPKVPLKFYKELSDYETTKLVLIYNNWKSKWQVNEGNYDE